MNSSRYASSLSAFGNGSGSGSERRIQAKTKIRGSTWESPSASAAVVTGSSDSYEKHLGRKDRADSIAADLSIKPSPICPKVGIAPNPGGNPVRKALRH